MFVVQCEMAKDRENDSDEANESFSNSSFAFKVWSLGPKAASHYQDRCQKGR